MSKPPLYYALHTALCAMWRRRTHREQLLDLGERKGWGERDLTQTLEAAAEWLNASLFIELPFESWQRPATLDLSVLHSLGNDLATTGPTLGVARWIHGLCRATGGAPKALANSLRTGLTSHRADHRWLRLIARVVRGGDAAQAWAYHLRTPQSVLLEIGSWNAETEFDAGDAVLLFSLLALWQRRRPTEQVRANRNRPASRRNTPKPIAGLRGCLLMHGQLEPLVALSNLPDSAKASALRTLVFEAALTEAHLEPHVPRRNARAPKNAGDAWFSRVESILRAPSVCGEDEAADFRFRIERMRAFRDGRQTSVADGDRVRSAYVRASRTIEEARTPGAVNLERFKTNETGLLMLLPLLRKRGLLEDP